MPQNARSRIRNRNLRVAITVGKPVRRSGRVKSFNTTKGYGFIQPDDGGPDVFLHIKAYENSGLAGQPPVGQRLEYQMGPGLKPGCKEAKMLKLLAH